MYRCHAAWVLVLLAGGCTSRCSTEPNAGAIDDELANEFRMVERPPREALAAPAWKIGIDLTAERKKPLFLYFTASW